MEWPIILLVAAAAFLALFPVWFVWYICIGGMRLVVKQRRFMGMACSLDADCPPGYTCVGGHCVPNKA